MINSIEDTVRLLLSGETDWQKYGCVKESRNGNLSLFNYTAQAQWENKWNIFEQLSRGLIINNQTGEIVARPFKKFFNLGQSYGDGKMAVPNDNTQLVNVFEKFDGSLGILYRQYGKHKIATRGSFDSDQALWATEYLFNNHDLTDLPDNLTLLFEIIYPENRIVINYGDTEDLVLLAVINRYTGNEYPFSAVCEIADYYGFNTPASYSFNNVQDILESASRLVGTESEGYVLLYSDGSRFKVKGDDYLFLHRIVTNITKKNVFQMWLEDAKFPDIPNEFLTQMAEWYEEFDMVSQQIEDEARHAYWDAPTASRKEFALAVKDHMYSSVIFAMYDENQAKVRSAINSLTAKICLDNGDD